MGRSSEQLVKMRGFMILLLVLAVVAMAYADTCNKGTKNPCKSKGGVCQSSKTKCNGDTFKGTKLCKGKSCICCVEEDEPTTTPEPTTTTTPVPTTTTPLPTTTTPVPTTTTPLPTTTTTMFDSTTWSSTPTGSYASWSTDSWVTPPVGGGDGCYNPVTMMYDIPISTESFNDCESFICTVNGWVLLEYFGDCCMFNDKSYPEGTNLSIMKENGECTIQCTYNGWIKMPNMRKEDKEPLETKFVKDAPF